MPSRKTSILAGLALAATVSAAASVAGAEEYRRVGGYGSAQGYGLRGAAYAFGDEAVRGAYVGAPLTRFPTPSQIVPAPWTYGTYGIPTVAGIERAPVGQPSLTIVHGSQPAPVRRQASGPRILSRDGDGRWARNDEAGYGQSGVRVVEIQVPRR
ncbi:hypothetical protein [Methylobacterium trifolii]|uniref:Uncharacterized protein n=1 Tax=Methylobacterium trifolii TaxID=1003092 RepID=A0ABQ4TRS4_9HYPH|nr:hypothetical protein [Methylobacterium trifolii]GJE58048.1 hypothetical protein MPOCJGCO_0125 [Methylobacterium trifolii]